jgi:hypothetical protein
VISPQQVRSSGRNQRVTQDGSEGKVKSAVLAEFAAIKQVSLREFIVPNWQIIGVTRTNRCRTSSQTDGPKRASFMRETDDLS